MDIISQLLEVLQTAGGYGLSAILLVVVHKLHKRNDELNDRLVETTKKVVLVMADNNKLLERQAMLLDKLTERK